MNVVIVRVIGWRRGTLFGLKVELLVAVYALETIEVWRIVRAILDICAVAAEQSCAV